MDDENNYHWGAAEQIKWIIGRETPWPQNAVPKNAYKLSNRENDG